MNLRRLVPPTVFALAIAAAGIAIPGTQLAAATKPPKIFDAAAERGEQIAARNCARCHSIDKTSPSPRASAPPFRDVRRRYNEISLTREFAAIGQVGHYEMPATPISQSEGKDLAAFIEGLGR